MCLFIFVGFCQAQDIHDTESSISGWHKHNNTLEHQAKRPPTSNGYQPINVKGEMIVKLTNNMFCIRLVHVKNDFIIH